MACFKIPILKTRPQKKITIQGLTEFQWLDIQEKEEIGRGSFGIAFKAKLKVPITPKRFFQAKEYLHFSEQNAEKSFDFG